MGFISATLNLIQYEFVGNRYNTLDECIAENQDCANILPKEICCQE